MKMADENDERERMAAMARPVRQPMDAGFTFDMLMGSVDPMAESMIEKYIREREAKLQYERTFTELVNYVERGPEGFSAEEFIGQLREVAAKAAEAGHVDSPRHQRNLARIEKLSEKSATWETVRLIFYDTEEES
ncbi:uncharacterized protein LOC144886658 [Branchiostoma floridae x Branchiostoma japonicum]